MSARRLRIVYTDDAKAELRVIALYTERQWGRVQRTAYRRLVREAVNTLAGSPCWAERETKYDPVCAAIRLAATSSITGLTIVR